MREGFNPYDVLGMERDATTEQIRARWRSLMQTNHPDRSDRLDAAEYFHEIETAGRILLDEERRAHWDAHGRDPADTSDRDPAQAWILKAIQDAVPRAMDGSPLLRILLNACIRERREVLQQIESLEAMREKLPDVMPVWGGDGPDPGLFAQAAARARQDVERHISEREARILLLNAVEALLNQHDDNPRAPKTPAPRGNPWAAATSATRVTADV